MEVIVLLLNIIHDYVSLYGAYVYVTLQLDLSVNDDYFKYVLSELDVSGDYSINVTNSAKLSIINGVLCVGCVVCSVYEVVRRCSPLWLCKNCTKTDQKISIYTYQMRPDLAELEEVLLLRPNVINRNAYHYETLDAIKLENEENL